MEHIPHQFNFWAILVSAIFIWLLGALWFSPLLFSKPWGAIVGRECGRASKGLAHAVVSSLIGDLLAVFVLDHFIIWGHAAGFLHGALLGLIAWIGFVLAINYPERIYEGRPFRYLVINSGYWLVGLVVAGGILASWR